MRDKIQAAIAAAREKNKGKIAPPIYIYEAIYRAGYQQGTDDTIKSRIVATAASEPWDREETVFEDGKKTGMKVVVDWIKDDIRLQLQGNPEYNLVNRFNWQAFLREKGL